MNRKCLYLLAAGALAVAGFGFTSGQGTPPAQTPTGKIAVCDIVKSFNECQRRKDFLEEMKVLQDKLTRENEARRQKIDELQAVVDKIDPNDPVYEQRARELMQQQVEYKNWFDLQQAEMNRQLAVWSVKIYREICAACEVIARERGFDLVFYKEEFEVRTMEAAQLQEHFRQRKVLFSIPEIEITQSVIDRMNADYRAQPKKPMIVIP